MFVSLKALNLLATLYYQSLYIKAQLLNQIFLIKKILSKEFEAAI